MENQQATFLNSDEGMCATVTTKDLGHVVVLTDCDSGNVVSCRMFPKAKGTQAIEYAKGLVFKLGGEYRL